MILGIDPGFARVGYCVLCNVIPLKYGTFETTARRLFEYRLFNIYSFLEDVIQTNDIELIVYENPVGLRGDNGFKVAQVIGIINLLAVKNDKNILAYTPSQIKKIVAGNSKATKTEMEAAVLKRCDKLEAGLLDDTYDAIGVALAHRLPSMLS